jgi:hypothetical protein
MSTPGQDRRYGAARTALITYGIAAYTYLIAKPGPADAAKAFGVGASASSFLLSGLGLQITVIAARLVIKRTIADQEMAAQALGILELIADGVTVLLFAMATFGAITFAPEDL